MLYTSTRVHKLGDPSTYTITGIGNIQPQASADPTSEKPVATRFGKEHTHQYISSLIERNDSTF
jgi:hypothetical protein